MDTALNGRKIILLVLVVLLLWPVLSIGSYLIYPDIASLKKSNPRMTAFMEYREQEWQKQGKKKTIVQTWVPSRQISPYLQRAVIIAEDDKFWSHEGFDFEAMQGALEKDLKKKKFKFGGSTISQQLAKNLFLSPSKSIIRKIREAILTWRLERTLSKSRILELYLNVVEWGDGIFGAEAAARHYFGKSASDLSAEEAARLATVLPNPKRMNPVGVSRYVDARSKIIYDIMVKRGIVIPEYDEMTESPSEPQAIEPSGAQTPLQPESGTPQESAPSLTPTPPETPPQN